MQTIEKMKLYTNMAKYFIQFGNKEVFSEAGLSIPNEETLKANDSNTKSKAEAFVADLELLGPTYIKVGQLLATRKELFPSELITALEKLQSNVAPVSFEDIEAVIEDEFSAKIKHLYKEFDPEPLAAASLGQVHMAKLHDGTQVVVKIQRPKIIETIDADIKSISKIVTFLNKHSKSFRRYHAESLIKEFKENMSRELNYVEEAYNLRKVKESLGEFSHIIFPTAYDSYCTSKVLTMDYLPGAQLNKIPEIKMTEIQGSQIVDNLFQAYLKQIFVDGFFHSDPHLGNLVYMGDNKLGIFDLGMVTRIGPHLQKALLSLIINISNGKGEVVAGIAYKMTSPLKDLEQDSVFFKTTISRLVKDYHDKPLEYLNSGEILFKISSIAGESGLYFPQELSSLARTLMYLDEIGKILDPNFDPHAVIKENAGKLLHRSSKEKASLSELFYDTIELKDITKNFPKKLDYILDDILDKKLAIKVEAIDQDKLMKGFQKIANRITAGLILAALIIGAVMLMDHKSSFMLLGYPGLAIILFSFAVLGAGNLLFNILMRDE